MEPPARTECRFDAVSPDRVKRTDTSEVEVRPGASGVAIRNGRLVGTTTSNVPLLRVERTGNLERHDQVHAVEVRMRVSHGENLQVAFSANETLEFAAVQATMAAARCLLDRR